VQKKAKIRIENVGAAARRISKEGEVKMKYHWLICLSVLFFSCSSSGQVKDVKKSAIPTKQKPSPSKENREKRKQLPTEEREQDRIKSLFQLFEKKCGRYLGKVGYCIVFGNLVRVLRVPYDVAFFKFRMGETLWVKIDDVLWKGKGRKRYGILMQDIEFKWVQNGKKIKLKNPPRERKGGKYYPLISLGSLKRGKSYILAFPPWSMGLTSVLCAIPATKKEYDLLKKKIQKEQKAKKEKEKGNKKRGAKKEKMGKKL